MRKISKLRIRDLRLRADALVGSWGETAMRMLQRWVKNGGSTAEQILKSLMSERRIKRFHRYGQWKRWNQANRRRQRQLRALRQLGVRFDPAKLLQNLRREDVP